LAVKNTAIGIGVALCVLLCTQVSVAQDTPDSLPVPQVSTAIDWLDDYNEVVGKAGDEDQHIIALFYTDWCQWCKVMQDSTFSDPQVIALNGRFVFLRVNAEVDTATANRFKISGYPTVVLLEKAGNEVDRILGYHPPAEFAETIESYLEGRGTYWALEKDNREKPNDPKTIYLMGKKQAERGNIADARAQFARVLSYDKKNDSEFADDAQFQLALLHRKERSWYKAVEAFRDVVKEYPESELVEDAQIYIGWLFAKAGDTKEALKSYREFLKEYSKSSETDWVKEQIQLLEEASEDDS
jgi:thioredoxin-like negative regulator of GroEL